MKFDIQDHIDSRLSERLITLEDELETIRKLQICGYAIKYNIRLEPQWWDGNDDYFIVESESYDVRDALSKAITNYKSQDLSKVSDEYRVTIGYYLNDYYMGVIPIHLFEELRAEGLV